MKYLSISLSVLCIIAFMYLKTRKVIFVEYDFLIDSVRLKIALILFIVVEGILITLFKENRYLIYVSIASCFFFLFFMYIIYTFPSSLFYLPRSYVSFGDIGKQKIGAKILKPFLAAFMLVTYFTINFISIVYIFLSPPQSGAGN